MLFYMGGNQPAYHDSYDDSFVPMLFYMGGNPQNFTWACRVRYPGSKYPVPQPTAAKSAQLYYYTVLYIMQAFSFVFFSVILFLYKLVEEFYVI